MKTNINFFSNLDQMLALLPIYNQANSADKESIKLDLAMILLNQQRFNGLIFTSKFTPKAYQQLIDQLLQMHLISELDILNIDLDEDYDQMLN